MLKMLYKKKRKKKSEVNIKCVLEESSISLHLLSCDTGKLDRRWELAGTKLGGN